MSSLLQKCLVRNRYSLKSQLRLSLPPIRTLRNAPKFDEFELYGKKLNNTEYHPQKPENESPDEPFDWGVLQDKKGGTSEMERMDRIIKMKKLGGMAQGLLIVIGLGVCLNIYLKWANVENWWLKTFNRDLKIDEKKLSFDKTGKAEGKAIKLPVIDKEELKFDVPGLYFWGGGKKVKFPRRVTQFDNLKLRDVCLVDDQYNFAVDDRGNLIEWNLKDNKFNIILKEQDLQKVKESNGCLYGLNKKGEVLIIPYRDGDLDNRLERYLALPGKLESMITPWKRGPRYGLKIMTDGLFDPSIRENKIVDFDVGLEHMLLLSNQGKVYSCSTGWKENNELRKSRGQFGVPSLSQFDKFPELNRLYEIKFLQGNTDNQKIIKKISCGGFHNLVLDSNNECHSFGWNRFGQLGFPITYMMEEISYPKLIPMVSFGQFYPSNENIELRIVDIDCNEETSFFTVEVSTANNRKDVKRSYDYFSMGNGIYGELGNGSVKNSQWEPTMLKLARTDTNDNINEWICNGKSHHLLMKSNDGNILSWGLNDNGQLGNGKEKIKGIKPAYMPRILECGDKS